MLLRTLHLTPSGCISFKGSTHSDVSECSACRFQASVTISFVESVCDHDAMFDECVRLLPQVSIKMEEA